VGEILRTLEREGIADDTLFVFTSDHGDMLGSHGLQRKQKPWDESIRVPFLLRYPARLGWDGGALDALIDAPDIMPTLLGLCDLPIPESVEGLDFSGYLAGGPDPSDGAALIACYQPFGEWPAGAGGPPALGGREYRGVRTARYTYTETLEGPWLLYDNYDDPYQTRNLVGAGWYAEVQARLADVLRRKLAATKDEFLPGKALTRQWGYPVDGTGTVPFVP
jgi:arylsulfatase A-like enzyme